VFEANPKSSAKLAELLSAKKTWLYSNFINRVIRLKIANLQNLVVQVNLRATRRLGWMTFHHLVHLQSNEDAKEIVNFSPSWWA